MHSKPAATSVHVAKPSNAPRASADAVGAHAPKCIQTPGHFVGAFIVDTQQNTGCSDKEHGVVALLVGTKLHMRQRETDAAMHVLIVVLMGAQKVGATIHPAHSLNIPFSKGTQGLSARKPPNIRLVPYQQTSMCPYCT
jgi:hypothetical protein